MDDRRHTLRHFPVVRTTSVDEARDAVTDVYLPHALRADGGRLRMRLNAARQRRFTLGFLAYGAHAELGMPATETTYHVNLTTRGTTYAERGDGTRAVTAARTSGVVLLPDQFNTVRWTDDAEQLILKIPRTRLESHLADLVGRPVDRPDRLRVRLQHGDGPRPQPARVRRVPGAGAGPAGRHRGDPAGPRAAGGVRDDAGAAGRAQLLQRRARGLRGAGRPSAAAGRADPHGDPRRPAADPRRAGQGRVHERPLAARDLPARARPLAHGAPAADPPRPRARRAAARGPLRRADQRHRHALGLLPPEPVRPPVPGAVRRAPRPTRSAAARPELLAPPDRRPLLGERLRPLALVGRARTARRRSGSRSSRSAAWPRRTSGAGSRAAPP